MGNLGSGARRRVVGGLVFGVGAFILGVVLWGWGQGESGDAVQAPPERDGLSAAVPGLRGREIERRVDATEMPRTPDCGEAIWGQGRSPDEESVRSLGEHLETAPTSCVRELPPAWRMALLQAECEGRLVVPARIKTQVVRSVSKDLQAALRKGGAGGDAVTPHIMVCMAEHAAAGDDSCALEFGRLLCIYAATRPPESLRSSTVLTEIVAKLGGLLGTSRPSWYGALFRGCDQANRTFVVVLEFVLSDALAGATREDALAFCEAAVHWVDLEEREAVMALSEIGEALEPFVVREDFTREKVLSKNVAERLVFLCAIPSKMRFPASRTPVFSAAANARDLQEFLTSDAGTSSTIGRSWRSTLVENAWSFLGHDAFQEFLYATAPDGFDRDVSWSVGVATGAIRALCVRQADFERLSAHPNPAIREWAVSGLAELAILQETLAGTLAKTSDPTLRQIQATCRGMPLHGESIEAKLRQLVGTRRSFEVLRDQRAPSPGK